MKKVLLITTIAVLGYAAPSLAISPSDASTAVTNACKKAIPGDRMLSVVKSLTTCKAGENIDVDGCPVPCPNK